MVHLTPREGLPGGVGVCVGVVGLGVELEVGGGRGHHGGLGS